MISFNRLKIGTKLMVSTALLITLTIAIISILIGYKTQQMAETDAQEIAKETAYHYANVLKAMLEVPLDEARAMGTFFEAAINKEGFEITREQANLIFKYFLAHRPHFFSTGAVFEPNGFDGKDADLINAEGHDETGRFIPYWSRNEQKEAVLTPIVNYDSEQWYLLPKQTKQEVVMEPFLYPVQGKDIWMTSLLIPILDNHRNFRGITWFDLSLEQLQKKIGGIVISSFKNAYLTVYSAQGTIVVSGDTTRLGNKIQQITDNQELIEKILKTEPFYLKRKSSKLNQTVMTYGAPVEIGNATARWIVAVNIPQEELYAESQHMVVLISIIGVTTILLVILTLYLLIRKMVKPLLQVNNWMKSLAQGELVEEEINYLGKDEIAEIIDSSQILKDAIKLTIVQVQAIAIGNYKQEVKPRSRNDQLGLALSEMTYSLRGIIAQVNAIANGDYTQEVKLLSEQDQLGQALSHMTKTLREMTTQNAEQNWIKSGQTQLNDKLSGEQDIMQIAENAINFITPYVEAHVGAFYLVQEQENSKVCLKMRASYAYTWRKNLANEFQIGEGIVGQVALERKTIIITNAPEDYITIHSGLGESYPRAILVIPFLYEDCLKGVIELASFSLFTEVQMEFLNQVMTTIGIVVNTAQSRSRMQVLLRQSESQSEELQKKTKQLEIQQTELQHSNEELQSQSEELQVQQEELRQINEELEQRTKELELQTEEIQNKNVALEQTKTEMEQAQTALETKAQELERANKYKSEFLANMSHELRTPLNSLLILAQLLSDNKSGNLIEKQIEYAQTIHSAGSDLLALINDILDLSKVEAGKMEVHLENLPITTLLDDLEQKFRHIAEQKELAFNLTVADHLPPVLQTDVQKLQQILNNLLSNAFKFTEKGEIKLTVHRPSQNSSIFQTEIGQDLLEPSKTIAISVTDTGIGIPKDKQQLIFQAFQQVDGSTSRRYGGTGLGLSISRQLTRLLGGELTLTSEAEQGSTFSLYLPEVLQNSEAQTFINQEHQLEIPKVSTQTSNLRTSETEVVAVSEPHKTLIQTANQVIPSPTPTSSEEIIDDRNGLQSGEQSILIIEDDRQFGTLLMQIARERQFKCIVAEDGKTGLQLAKEFQPNAILLDIGLPQVDGWTVMEQLKDNPDTRHIPVHFISGQEQDMDAKRMGAIGYLLKPVNMDKLNEALKKIEQFIAKTLKNLLIIVDKYAHQQKILEIVNDSHVQSIIARTQEEALQQLHQTPMDCIILDIDIEQQSGLKLLEQIQQEDNLSQIPVILYTNRDLTQSEAEILHLRSEKLTVKAVRTPERLLDETTLFLHQLEASLPKEKRKILQMVHDKEAIFAQKQVLIVDDDMRNTFALITVLEEKNMEILVAENGKEALEILEKSPELNIILMDIMMPEMDGYEAIRKIRSQPRFHRLPIIALTAKAMKGDKTKCIEAGANDYISKPVETNKLLSLMRVWLYQ